MSTRSERDRQKSSQERHQSILSQLLKDEDNKYCVDCDAKGPRWASWNLGIFLCIRCAGIHRNLGVHISKVKSVNLDSWTGEQVAMMQEMGNSRARAVYEANLPDNFRRPQTDSGLEAFIRGKYEQKRYIAREWIPPQPKVQPTYDEPKKEKKRTRPKPQTSQNMPVSTATVQAKAEEPKPAPKPAPVPSRQEAAAADLLSLDADPVPQSDAGQADLFGDFVGNPLPTEAPLQPALNSGDASAVASSSPATATAESQPAADGIDLFGESSGGEEQRKAQKKDILALYASSGPPNQQMFGVPGGVYMPQQAPMMQNNMMPNAAMMQMQPQQQQMQQMPQQQMMMGGGASGMQQGYFGMPQNAGGMMGQYQQPQQQQQGMYGNMGNMNMYAMQQPQFQQIQNQMASMALGPSANSFQQQPTPIAAGGTPAGNYGNWGGQPMGQTLSGNLWK